MDYLFALAFGIGIVTGLRSLLTPAAIAWAAHLGWIDLSDSPLAFMGSAPAVIVFPLLALGELIADKLPRTPARTTALPLIARILIGGLCGACLFSAAGKQLAIGAVIGAIGGLVGTYAGYELRRRLVTGLHARDLVVALCEDAAAIGLAFLVISH